MPTGVHVATTSRREERQCGNCGSPYFPIQAIQKFCSPECGYKYRYGRSRDVRIMLEGLAVAMTAAGIDVRQVAAKVLGRGNGGGHGVGNGGGTPPAPAPVGKTEG